MFSLVVRLAPHQPTLEEVSHMSQGGLLFTQCAGILSNLTQSHLAQILVTAFNAELKSLAAPPPPPPTWQR